MACARSIVSAPEVLNLMSLLVKFKVLPEPVIVSAFKLMLSTSRAVKVPTLVMFVCAAPVTVAAVPEVF